MCYVTQGCYHQYRRFTSALMCLFLQIQLTDHEKFHISKHLLFLVFLGNISSVPKKKNVFQERGCLFENVLHVHGGHFIYFFYDPQGLETPHNNTYSSVSTSNKIYPVGKKKEKKQTTD